MVALPSCTGRPTGLPTYRSPRACRRKRSNWCWTGCSECLCSEDKGGMDRSFDTGWRQGTKPQSCGPCPCLQRYELVRVQLQFRFAFCLLHSIGSVVAATCTGRPIVSSASPSQFALLSWYCLRTKQFSHQHMPVTPTCRQWSCIHSEAPHGF